MTEIYFIISLAVIFSIIYAAAFRNLPGERWQVFAVIPVHKTNGNLWHGINITYYGLLTATGYTLAVVLLVIMLISAGTAPLFLLFFLSGVLIFFIPSAKLIAFFMKGRSIQSQWRCGIRNVYPGSFTDPDIKRIIVYYRQQARGRYCIPCLPHNRIFIRRGFRQARMHKFRLLLGKAVVRCTLFFQKLFADLIYLYRQYKKKYHIMTAWTE
jgi:hypothetical protein